jgi:hypothetical protein
MLTVLDFRIIYNNDDKHPIDLTRYYTDYIDHSTKVVNSTFVYNRGFNFSKSGTYKIRIYACNLPVEHLFDGKACYLHKSFTQTVVG